MRKIITIEVGSHLAASSMIGTPVETWHEVAALLHNPKIIAVPYVAYGSSFEFTADTADVLDYLALAARVESGNDAAGRMLQRRFKRRAAAGQCLTAADLHVTAAFTGELTASFLNHALLAFLQKLFLATNLACPGSCDLGGTLWDGLSSEAGGGLHVDRIGFAATHAVGRGWPRLRRIPVSRVWDWLDENSFDHIVLGETSLSKALLTILRIGGSEFDDAHVLVQLAGVFESMFVDRTRSASGAIKERIEIILGQPPTHANWFSKLYSARSKIVHGSDPIVRPGYLFSELPLVQEHMASAWPSLDQLIGIHVALLQELTLRGSSAFTFGETVGYA